MLKDRLFKTSGWQFHKWLFGPKTFSGLSRNGPQDLEKRAEFSTAVGTALDEQEVTDEETLDTLNGKLKTAYHTAMARKLPLQQRQQSQQILLWEDERVTRENLDFDANLRITATETRQTIREIQILRTPGCRTKLTPRKTAR